MKTKQKEAEFRETFKALDKTSQAWLLDVARALRFAVKTCNGGLSCRAGASGPEAAAIKQTLYPERV